MQLMTRQLGIGLAWRPELALSIDRDLELGFVEVIAEDLDPWAIPTPLMLLRERGLPVIPHGIGLSLGSTEPPEPVRLAHLAELATCLRAPVVSEHIAFVRSGDLESGHLLPLPRTQAMLDVLVENIRLATRSLPVPLALENIATLVEWPEPEMDEPAFLSEVLERTESLLLLDLENVYANACNHGFDPLAYLERLPLDRLAYVHVAGGIERDGLYHDTHAHRVPANVLALLEELCARTPVPGVLLERDDRFPRIEELIDELDAIRAAAFRGNRRRT
jgi:uncharacterized protein (UPF0276 family)